jgi:Flp pilus assembly protein TadG
MCAMSSRRSVVEAWRDLDGASLVEFTIIMPVLFILTLGTVDLGYFLYDCGMVSKAVYAGAHRAIVSNPAASTITTVAWTSADIGNDCSTSAGLSGFCTGYAATTTCTKTGNTGACTVGTYDNTAFTDIVSKMQTTLGCTAGSTTCLIQPANVSVTYAITGTLGFVGQPNGLPMNITVAVSCVYHQFFFVGGLLNLTFPTPQGCKGTPNGWTIPSYATTLTSEDMATN